MFHWHWLRRIPLNLSRAPNFTASIVSQFVHFVHFTLLACPSGKKNLKKARKKRESDRFEKLEPGDNLYCKMPRSSKYADGIVFQ